MARTRIVLVGNTDHSMVHFRSALIERLVKEDYDVHVVVPPGPYRDALTTLGTTVVPWRLTRRSTDPTRELRSLAHLTAIHRRLDPDLAHYFSLKPGIYGPIAARAAGVAHTIVSITGLGYVFTGEEMRARMLRRMVLPLCRASFGLADEVLFQNEEDRQIIQAAGALPAGRGIVMLGGEGIDADFFDPARVEPAALDELRREIGLAREEKVVLLVARVLGHKGVREYVEAARTLRGEARFLLVGPLDEQNPSAIPEEEVRGWHTEGVIQHLGERSDIRELLALADIAVLPSYREGTSQFLLEASAMGCPIIATNVPGCRVVVDADRTGLLVPPRDARALAEALHTMLGDADMRARMGVAVRQRALTHFDVQRVVDRLIGVYDDIQAGSSGRRTA